MEEIKNKVKESGLMQMDLADFKPTTEIIEIDGEKKILWKCNCGAERIFKANSGWVVGHKVTWRAHFEDVINRRKRK